ncbi:MAG: hypothetical protein IPP25_15005 [Saprospiraceae bacterium]|nr:hypothetical protein [Candidatus Opimibacter skivensis]
MFYDTSLNYSRIVASWDQVKKIGTPQIGIQSWCTVKDLMNWRNNTIHYPHLRLSRDTRSRALQAEAEEVPLSRHRIESDLLFSQMRNE